jgi:xylan 1,4-beta-xylosidase
MQIVLIAVIAAAAAADADTVTTVGVDLGDATTPLTHFWKASVGSGHAKLGLRADWQQQLSNVHRDTGIAGVRFHGSFDDDMGPVVVGDPTKGPVTYNFSLQDKLWDGIKAAGVRPIVELSFMPQALANCAPGKCHTTMYYKGIATPPKRFNDWYDLIKAFASHLVDRYGIEEIAQWKFEVCALVGRMLFCSKRLLMSLIFRCGTRCGG